MQTPKVGDWLWVGYDGIGQNNQNSWLLIEDINIKYDELRCWGKIWKDDTNELIGLRCAYLPRVGRIDIEYEYRLITDPEEQAMLALRYL